MIVRGWRSRRESETCSAVISSSARRERPRTVDGLGVGACRDASRPGLISIAPDATGSPGPLAIGRRSSPTGIAHRGRPSGEPAGPASGLIRPLPRVRWTSLATGVHSADEVGRATGHELDAVRERREQPGGRGGIAVHRGVGDPDLDDRVRVRHGHDRGARARPRTRWPGRCRCRRAGRCGPRPSPRAPTSDAIVASFSSEPRIRSNGCGMPTRPPCARAAAIGLGGRQAGRDRPLEEAGR